MHGNDSLQYIVLLYLLFFGTRIRGYFRRWRQPLLRGRAWFFSVSVQPDFYTGAGRRVLHRYWMRMFIPCVLDIPIAMAAFVPGHIQYMPWLMVVQAALIHINHVFSVDRAERQARRFVLPESEQPAAAVACSLHARRLRDYTHSKVEGALALSSAVALLWLIRYYFATADHHSLRHVFGVPVLCLYIQLGLLFVKRVVVAWRNPVPRTQAAEHMEAREETRKYYLRMCDWNRAAATAGILFWPILLSASPARLTRLSNVWTASWLVIGVVAAVWVEIKRKQLVTMALSVRPVKLPDLLHQAEVTRWPLCYQPSSPLLVLKGARGYSLNLANTLAHLGAAYMAGLMVLLVLLRTGY
ncbi:MAG: hypothetical protein LAO21_08720 [Acidobacteriia bacterium]|nr:hypothetical protein [Terriglobia bacterium]